MSCQNRRDLDLVIALMSSLEIDHEVNVFRERWWIFQVIEPCLFRHVESEFDSTYVCSSGEVVRGGEEKYNIPIT